MSKLYRAVFIIAVIVAFEWWIRWVHIPGAMLWANDGPLGWQMSCHQQDAIRQPLTGHWNDLNWIGVHELDVIPSASYIGCLLFTFLAPLCKIAFWATVICGLNEIYTEFSRWTWDDVKGLGLWLLGISAYLAVSILLLSQIK